MDSKNQKLITIKRYSNRKLYDTSQSRYITLAELGELVRRGENIEVIDNDTKADLTEVTLTQVLITQQKQKQKGIRSLVQSQAEILLQRISVPIQQIRDEAIRQVEKQVEKLKRYTEHTVPEKTAPEQINDYNNSNDYNNGSEEHTPHSPSLDLKIESLKASSDEKLLSLILVQHIEKIEEELSDLRRRLELLERKDDDMY